MTEEDAARMAALETEVLELRSVLRGIAGAAGSALDDAAVVAEQGVAGTAT